MVYSKICIMCNREFKTNRISTVFCSIPPRKCANASRKLPPRMKEQLIKRSQQFTMSVVAPMGIEQDIRGKEFTPQELSEGLALARIEAARRGIISVRRDATTYVDNSQFIYKDDPANGDSSGFSTEQLQELKKITITTTTGIKKIGGLKV